MKCSRTPISPRYLPMALAILLGGCGSERSQCEWETIATLDQLADWIHKYVEVGQLSKVKDYGDLLRLMRDKKEPEKEGYPETYFRKDGWREPFSFEERREANAVIFIISSTHLDHYKKPLSLTVTLTDENKLTFSKSWKNK